MENVYFRLLCISGLHQEGQTKSPNVYTAAAECVQSNKYQTIADWRCPYKLSKEDASILRLIQPSQPPMSFTHTCLTMTLKRVVMLLADQLSRDGLTRPGSCQEVELLHLEQLEASTGVEGGDREGAGGQFFTYSCPWMSFRWARATRKFKVPANLSHAYTVTETWGWTNRNQWGREV